MGRRLYVSQQHGSRYYGKATNIARRLRAAYDAVLARHDLLLMPTTPIKATPLPSGRARAASPAMAIPCGMSHGLPVSVMLIGRHFDEPTIYRAAHAFEQSEGWGSL